MSTPRPAPSHPSTRAASLSLRERGQLTNGVIDHRNFAEPRAVLPPGIDSPYRGNYASLPTVMLKPPSEGNRTVPVIVLWTRDGQPPSYTIHFNARAQQVVSLSQICALHVDNTQCSATINVVFPDTNFQLQLGPNSEGFYPVVTNSLEFYAYIDVAPGPNDRSVIQVLNFMPPPIEFGSGSSGVAVGTVRRVDTVAPLQGGPITDQGSVSLATPLQINFGGTGAATAPLALDSLSGASGATSGSLVRNPAGAWSVTAAGAGTITQVVAGNGLTGGGSAGSVSLALLNPVSIANGGTGAASPAAALTALGGAPLASPGFTGTPNAPTPAAASNDTSLATTFYVTRAVATITAGGPWLSLTGGATSGAVAINMTLPPGGNAGNLIAAGALSTRNYIGHNTYLNAAGAAWLHMTGTGTAGVFSYDSAANNFTWYTAPNAALGAALTLTQRMALSGTGNLQIASLGAGSVVPPSAQAGTCFAGIYSAGGNIAQNGYYNGANWVHWVTGMMGLISFDTSGGGWYIQTAASGAVDTVATPVNKWQLDVSGNMVIAGTTAYKVGGGTWTDSSDIRVKQAVADYSTGLQAVLALQPRTWQFNGKGETPDDGKIYIGLVADEAETIMPEMIGTREVLFDPGDAAKTAIKTLDATALIYALVNSIKELETRLAKLEPAP